MNDQHQDNSAETGKGQPSPVFSHDQPSETKAKVPQSGMVEFSQGTWPHAADTPFKKGRRCSCPRCGDGPLYDGLLEVKKVCQNCGFDLTAADAGDGAQVFVILILGALSVILGFYLFGVLQLPRWLAMGILMAAIVGAALWMLRIFKAIFIALQFHHDAGEGQLDESADLDVDEKDKGAIGE